MIVGWLISCVDVPAQLVVVSAQIFVDVRGILPDVMGTSNKNQNKTNDSLKNTVHVELCDVDMHD